MLGAVGFAGPSVGAVLSRGEVVCVACSSTFSFFLLLLTSVLYTTRTFFFCFGNFVWIYFSSHKTHERFVSAVGRKLFFSSSSSLPCKRREGSCDFLLWTFLPACPTLTGFTFIHDHGGAGKTRPIHPANRLGDFRRRHQTR